MSRGEHLVLLGLRGIGESTRLLELQERLRAARGRPGGMIACAPRLDDERYRRGGRLFLTLLCTDTEIAPCQTALNPRSDLPQGDAA